MHHLCHSIFNINAKRRISTNLEQLVAILQASSSSNTTFIHHGNHDSTFDSFPNGDAQRVDSLGDDDNTGLPLPTEKDNSISNALHLIHNHKHQTRY